MKPFNITEEMVLLAVWKLEGNAYGVTIRQYLSEKTDRIFPYGTLYSILAKLEKQGMVVKTIGDPTSERGGRSKNYYHITPEGLRALKQAMELKQNLWDDETQLALSNI